MNEKLLYSKSPYLTTEYLLDLFKDMASPKMKISDLTKNNELISIKRGIYLHGDMYQRDFSRLVLAGLIYGPSAISFESALSLHNLIPERVEAITSICFKRKKLFQTPVGRFTYKYIPKELYPLGINYHQTNLGNFFIASPEKAICDMAYFEKLTDVESAKSYMLDSLRIDRIDIQKLNLELLLKLEKSYKRKSISLIKDAIGDMK